MPKHFLMVEFFEFCPSLTALVNRWAKYGSTLGDLPLEHPSHAPSRFATTASAWVSFLQRLIVSIGGKLLSTPPRVPSNAIYTQALQRWFTRASAGSSPPRIIANCVGVASTLAFFAVGNVKVPRSSRRR
jgi:hypothetical protein